MPRTPNPREIDFRGVIGGPDEVRAAAMCADAMRCAASVAGEVAALPGVAGNEPRRATPGSSGANAPLDTPAMLIEEALHQLELSAKALRELRRNHRSATLSAVANGALTAGEAIARVDAVQSLAALTHHAWRCAAHLVGRE